MEIIDSIVGSSIPSGSKVGYIGLGKEVGNIRGRINNRGTDDANEVGDIGASDVGLEEGSMNLTNVDRITSFRIQCPDIIF